MYVHPDPLINAALVDALASSTREIEDRIYIDWDGDGFQSAYQDMSLVASDIDLERASLVTDMPEAVNTIQGYSSAELTLTLSGRRYSDEDTVDVLLSRFNLNGPFYNRDLTGAWIKYEHRVYVSGVSVDYVDIRQFTGKVRDLQISHQSGNVSIVCGDAMDWIGAPVTLPHWACDRYITSSAWAGARRPINAAWVVGEVLRQTGTYVGPKEREDCVASFSCMGAMLPNIGDTYNFLNRVDSDPHGLLTDAVDLLTKRTDVPYGTCIVGAPNVGAGDARGVSGNTIRTVRSRGYLTVPRNGTSDAQRNFGFNGWVYDNGLAGHTSLPSGVFWPGEGVIQEMCIELGDNPNLAVQITRNGQVFVWLQSVSGGSAAQWGWNRRAGQTAGWHYYDVNVRFKNNAVQTVVTVDGVQLGAANYGGDLAAGFAYISNSYPPGTPDKTSNTMNVYYYDEAQFLQCYWGDSSAVYRPGQQFPPTTIDGLPQVVFKECLAEMSYLPDVENADAWEILGKLAIGEFATLMTNEFHQLIFEPHYIVQNNTSLQPQATYTVDNVLDLVTNPSLDQYRNSITLAYTDRYQGVDDIWTNDGPYDFTTPADTTTRIFPTVYNVDDVVRMVTAATPVVGWQDAPGNGYGTNYQQTYYSRYTAIPTNSMGQDARDPNHDGSTADGYFFQSWVIPSSDQRGLQIATRNGSTTNPALYVGARVIDNNDGTVSSPVPATSYVVKGKKIGDTKTGWYTLDDPDGIAQNGRYTLRLDASEWRQTQATAIAIAQGLLADTKTPAPIVTGLKIPTDGRLQVADVIAVQPGHSFSGPVNVQIMGISRSRSDGQDTISGRITRSPSKWNLGVVGLSDLGVTTVLN